MAHIRPQHPTGKDSITSAADSGVSIREDDQSEKESLYGDLKSYLARKQKHWLLARNIEIARPLQEKYLAYEAEIGMKICDTERERDAKYNRQAEEMRGATGLAKVSWSLYKLKLTLCSKWTHYQLHCRWKQRQLSAKRKELSEEYVRVQTGRRMKFLREIIQFANDEAVDDRDDGGYMRDGMLNYIVTGYDSLFPIARELEREFSGP